MNRVDAFAFKTLEMPYRKNALKLSQEELNEILEFIRANDQLGHLEFEYAANRWKLDQPKTKNHSIMVEFLLTANTATHGSRRAETNGS